jgi:hypothetical protein
MSESGFVCGPVQGRVERRDGPRPLGNVEKEKLGCPPRQSSMIGTWPFACKVSPGVNHPKSECPGESYTFVAFDRPGSGESKDVHDQITRLWPWSWTDERLLLTSQEMVSLVPHLVKTY